MTIKARNRLNLALFIFSLLIFLFDLFFFGYQHYNHAFNIPSVYHAKEPSTNLVFGYRPFIVISAILLELFYSVITLYFVRRNFIKTQSSIILFLIIFLCGCVFDSFRILIPLFHISGTFSQALLLIGNTSLFGRLLSPASLLLLSLHTLDEQPINSDRNLMLLIIFSLFIATIIPINTAIILPTFIVSYSYSIPVLLLIITIEVISVFTIFFNNLKNDDSQLPTIGFAMMVIGYTLFVNATSLFLIALSFVILVVGTIIYLLQLHNNYLWR